MRKIEHRNQFSTGIKGNNSVPIWRNLPIYNPKPLLPNINYYAKFEKICQEMLQIESRNEVVTDGQTDGHLTQIFERMK